MTAVLHGADRPSIARMSRSPARADAVRSPEAVVTGCFRGERNAKFVNFRGAGA